MRLIGEARIRDLLPAGSPGRLEASGVIFLGDRQAALVGAAGPAPLGAATQAGPGGTGRAGLGGADRAAPGGAGRAGLGGAERAGLGGAELAGPGGAGRVDFGGAGRAGDGRYLVIFDNLRAVARIGADLSRVADNDLVWSPPATSSQGYEDIARDPSTGHVFLLIESDRRDGGYQARVEEYDADLHSVASGWLEYPIARANKGIEGLEFVRRDDGVHLLGLHESGGLLVFRPGRRNWKHVATVDLPDDLGLADFSGISLAGDRIALISQQSAALWVGELAPDKWAAAGLGRTYRFPSGYRTVEGVCWIGSSTVVVVSDRSKRDSQPAHRRDEEESLHLFEIDD